MSKLIACNSSGILYRPPTRPDPRARLDRGRAHERPSVVQPAQKGPTCVYYALKKVRVPIGKDAPGLEKERSLEKRFSTHRKYLTKADLLTQGISQEQLSRVYESVFQTRYMKKMVLEMEADPISSAFLQSGIESKGYLAKLLPQRRWSLFHNIFHRIQLRDLGSTAAQLRGLGVPVHDADRAVDALLEQGGAAVAAVARAFPARCAPAGRSGEKRTPNCRRRNALARLEAILHPLAQRRHADFIARARRRRLSVVALDIPLLFETGGEGQCDAVAVVTCPAFLQEQRVLRRPG